MRNICPIRLSYFLKFFIILIMCINYCNTRDNTDGIVVDMSNRNLQTLQPNAFEKTPNVRDLNLTQNNLSIIKRGTFNGLKNLKDLNLSNNTITTIESNSFTGVNLHILQLQGNNLDNVSAIIESCDSLAALDVSWNALQTLDSFVGCTKLQLLILAHNEIRILSNGILPKSSVNLSLGHNRLESIDINAFEGLNRLTTLDLAYNGLSTLPNGLFASLGSLQGLYLSHNKLRGFSRGIFTHLTSLSRLNLGYNNFTSLADALFLNLPMDSLTIDRNKLTKPNGRFLCYNRNVTIEVDTNLWSDEDLLSKVHVDVTKGSNNTDELTFQGFQCEEDVIKDSSSGLVVMAIVFPLVVLILIGLALYCRCKRDPQTITDYRSLDTL